jgi:Ser-tRNA(Ala) deacylase AlaX
MEYKLTYQLKTDCPSGCGFNYCNKVREGIYTKTKVITADTEDQAREILMSEKHMMAGTEREIRIVNIELL